MDINVNIRCEDLSLAAGVLAKAINNIARIDHDDAPSAPELPRVLPDSEPEQAPAETKPEVTPSYTGAQIAKAGADLLAKDRSVMPKLMGLLKEFEVPAATELKPEQCGPFAERMRELGADL